MRSKLLLGLVFAAFVVIGMDCSSTGPTKTELAAPVWECPQIPTAPVVGGVGGYGGIGARSDGNSIHLRWYIGDEEELIGYQVFRRDPALNVYRRHETVVLTADQLRNRRGQPIEWIDGDVTLNQQYFYIIFAIDPDSNRSAPSDTLSYGLVGKPTLVSPDDYAQLSDPTPVFVFGHELHYLLLVNGYVLRVERDTGTDWELAWVSPQRSPALQGLPNDRTSIEYGDGGQVFLPELPPGRYRWRVDFQGVLNAIPPELPCRCVYAPSRCEGADPTLPLPSQFSHAGSSSRWREFTIVTQ